MLRGLDQDPAADRFIEGHFQDATGRRRLADANGHKRMGSMVVVTTDYRDGTGLQLRLVQLVRRQRRHFVRLAVDLQRQSVTGRSVASKLIQNC